MRAARAVAALAAGCLFGLGLAVSGMLNPAKVLAFLDLFGQWDPSLAAVMGTAIPVAMLFYRIAARRGTVVPAPSAAIDRPLVIGALLFGIGWGLVGLCPGPALAAMPFVSQSWLFVAAMLVGMRLRHLI